MVLRDRLTLGLIDPDERIVIGVAAQGKGAVLSYPG